MDAEFPGSISSRKLVIETAKFNVITAYGGDEAVETLQRFPNMDAAVLNAADRDMPCSVLVERLKKLVPTLPVVVSSANGDEDCGAADHNIRSYDPGGLLETLQALFPEATGEIKRTEKTLAVRKENS